MTRLVLAGLVVASLACGSVRVAFPTGAGVPEPEAIARWWAATQTCKNASSYSAEIRIGGKVGTEKLRSGTLQGAMTRDGGIRLLAVAPVGAPIFVLAGTTERATLTLPREKRFITAATADIVWALIGLRLTPIDWLDLATGCVTSAPADSGERLGKSLFVRLQHNAGRVRLDPEGAAWRIVAGERPDLLIEYRQFQGSWPAAARVASRTDASVFVGLDMTFSQISVNDPALRPQAFVANVPADFLSMTLNELRAIGPLGVEGARPAPTKVSSLAMKAEEANR